MNKKECIDMGGYDLWQEKQNIDYLNLYMFY